MLNQTPVLNPESMQAQAISDLFLMVLWVCLGILALVTGLVVFAIVRYRHRGTDGEGEPRQVFGHLKVEILWTAVPFMLLVWVFYLTARTMNVSDPQQPHDPDLIVIGHQWWWEVRYPKAGIVTANEIHLPAGRRLSVQLESADVIHSFWVPELGRKMDMIPGHPNALWLEADRAGSYVGACSEYCGAQHAWMRLLVIVQTPDEFEQWARAMREPPPVPTRAEVEEGLNIFREKTCANCHTIEGVSPANSTAPDLTHLADRRTLGAGVLEHTPQTLTEWLRDPQAIKPASHMPDLHLDEDELTRLVAYLETLK